MMSLEQHCSHEQASHASALEGVVRALRLVESRLSGKEIDLASSLVDDLAFDSIRFVDLTFALQDSLGIDEFPMQEWIDQEMQKTSKRLTVESLVDRCAACMAAQGLVEK